MKKFLITGGAGFIGSNFIQYLFNEYGDNCLVHNIDVLTYAGNLENLKTVSNHPNYKFHRVDISDQTAVGRIMGSQDWDCVINFAAESHVDRSIESAGPFVKTNIVGTQVLLDWVKKLEVKRYIQISTDEVYGTLGETGYFTEETPLAPNSPYSASKASADLLVRAYYETYKLPVLITRCSNNYGPHQHQEKLIPLMISNALADKPLPVYGKGQNIRDWIFVTDHCRGIHDVFLKGKPGEIYNFGGHEERRNIDVVKAILKHLKKPETLITHVTDRLGHDYRYAIDSKKAETQLNWKPQLTFEDGLEKTINWYKNK